MSDKPKIGGRKHKQHLAMIANKNDEIETLLLSVDDWLTGLIKNPPRTADQWRAAGYQLRQLIITGQIHIRGIDKDLEKIQEIIRNAPQ